MCIRFCDVNHSYFRKYWFQEIATLSRSYPQSDTDSRHKIKCHNEVQSEMKTDNVD